MKYEVEQKFRVGDFGSIEAAVTARGGQFTAPQRQVDRYFNHPARDFSQTDEALRVRSVGEENCITYKGPKIDATTKTRREIETAIASGEAPAGQFAQMFAELGFTETATVQKQRRSAQLQQAGFEIEVTLDVVDQVGNFVELETAANDDNLDAARAALTNVAAELGLREVERRSYLELLLEFQQREK